MTEKIYPTGMWFNKRHEKAPDFIRGKISIKVDDFLKWVDNSAHLINDKGYMNFQLLEGGKEGLYLQVDTYGLIPTVKQPKQEIADSSEIPF